MGTVKLTDRVKVATRAQKTLLHIVLMLKVWLISSIENRTPPMGEPNATATPAALAAVMISRVLPIENNKQDIQRWERHLLWLRLNLSNAPATNDPTQQAT